MREPSVSVQIIAGQSLSSAISSDDLLAGVVYAENGPVLPKLFSSDSEVLKAFTPTGKLLRKTHTTVVHATALVQSLPIVICRAYDDDGARYGKAVRDDGTSSEDKIVKKNGSILNVNMTIYSYKKLTSGEPYYLQVGSTVYYVGTKPADKPGFDFVEVPVDFLANMSPIKQFVLGINKLDSSHQLELTAEYLDPKEIEGKDTYASFKLYAHDEYELGIIPVGDKEDDTEYDDEGDPDGEFTCKIYPSEIYAYKWTARNVVDLKRTLFYLFANDPNKANYKASLRYPDTSTEDINHNQLIGLDVYSLTKEYHYEGSLLPDYMNQYNINQWIENINDYEGIEFSIEVNQDYEYKERTVDDLVEPEEPVNPENYNLGTKEDPVYHRDLVKPEQPVKTEDNEDTYDKLYEDYLKELSEYSTKLNAYTKYKQEYDIKYSQYLKDLKKYAEDSESLSKGNEVRFYTEIDAINFGGNDNIINEPTISDYKVAMSRIEEADEFQPTFLMSLGLGMPDYGDYLAEVGQRIFAFVPYGIMCNKDDAEAQAGLAPKQSDKYNILCMTPYDLNTSLADFVVPLSAEVAYIRRYVANKAAGRKFAPIMGKTNGSLTYSRPSVVLTKSVREKLLDKGIMSVIVKRATNTIYLNKNKACTSNSTFVLSEDQNCRLAYQINRDYKIIMEQFLGEFNTPDNRKLAEKLLNQYNQNNIFSQIYTPASLRVQCDDGNNPPDIIAANKMVVDVYAVYNNTIYEVNILHRVYDMNNAPEGEV